MARHSHLPPAQRVDRVLAVLRGTEKLEVLARRHQVSAHTLRRWRDEYVATFKFTWNGTTRPGWVVRWLSPGDYLALAISASDSTARLYKREADGTLTTVATAASALSLSTSTEYEARVIVGDDPGDSNLQQLTFTVDTDRDGDYSDETPQITTTAVDDVWSAGLVGLYRTAGGSAAQSYNDVKVWLDHDEDGILDAADQTFVWDAENRLVEVRPTTPGDGDRKVVFGYDQQGRRVQKCVLVWDPTLNGGNGGWSDSPGLGAYARRFVWSGWLMLLELEGSVGVPPVDTVMRKYTWGLDLAGLSGSVGQGSALPSQNAGLGGPASLEGAGGIGGLLAMQAPGAGPGSGDLNAVYTYDANGNVGQLIAWATGFGGAQGDEWHVDRLVAHYEYDPYGGVTAQAGMYADENTFRFSTKYWDDETALGYWGRRYYSPSLGRWISRDPIGERGGTNLCAYVANRPADAVDPVGLDRPNDWAIGQARLRAAFWHYMFGYGQPWYRDGWAPDVQELESFQSMVNSLTGRIQRAACQNHVTRSCGQEQSEHFSDAAFDTAWNKPSLMPLGEFYVWAEADCRFTRACSSCTVRHRCTVSYEVRDQFDFDGGWDESALMFVTKILNGVPRTVVWICGIFNTGCREVALDEMGDGGHPFTIFIRWRGAINGEVSCDGK